MSLSRVLLAALAIAGGGTAHAGSDAPQLKTLFQFSNAAGSTPYAVPINIDGQLFGTTFVGGTASSGVIFQFDPKTGGETVLYSFKDKKDGSGPDAGLVYHAGQLFGSTIWGGNPPQCGNNGCGIVFRFDLKKGKEVVLHRFSGGADGGIPMPGNLVYLNGKLYGTTMQGGLPTNSGTAGTLFQIKP